MPINRNRVLTIDNSAVQALTDKFRPLAKIGLKADEANKTTGRETKLELLLGKIRQHPNSILATTVGSDLEPIRADVKGMVQALSEYVSLVSILLEHQTLYSLIFELDELAKKAKEIWSQEERKLASILEHGDKNKKHGWLRDIQIAQIDRQLTDLLRSNQFAYSTIKDFLDRLEKVKTPDELLPFFELVKKDILDREKETWLEKTIIDLNKVWLHGERVEKNRFASSAKLDRFVAKLRQKNAQEDVIAFLSQHLNQYNLMTGINFFLVPFKSNISAAGFSLMKVFDDERNHVEIEADGSAIVTSVNEYFGIFDDSIPGQMDAKAVLKFRIRHVAENEPPNNIVVEILDGYLDIYNDKAREIFISSKLTEIVPKIRKPIGQQPDQLFANDQRILNLHLAGLVTSSNKIDPEKIKNLTAEQLFLLMWSNEAHAESILKDNLFSAHVFFGRSYSEIERDLVTIQNKHYLSDKIKTETDHYLYWIRTLERHQRTPIDAPDRFDFELMSSLPDLTQAKKGTIYLSENPRQYYHSGMTGLAPIPPEIDITNLKNKIKNSSFRNNILAMTTREGHTPPTRAVNLQEIANQLAKPGILKNYLLTAMLSIDNANFIRELVSNREIRNHLNEAVLTRFALKDENIARTLLQPSLWERFRFSMKKLFRRITPEESLPVNRFSSPSLKNILVKFPSLWQSAFRPSSKARANLKGAELRELISVDQPRDQSYFAGYQNVFEKDRELRDAAVAAKEISVSEQLVYHRENHHVTLNLLADNGQLELYNTEASEEDLKAFYRYKFVQASKTNGTFLIEAIEDFWGHIPTEVVNGETQETLKRNLKWSYKIPPHRKELVKAALIEVACDLQVDTSNLTFTTKYKLPKHISYSDIFVSRPFSNAFRTDVFPPEVLQKLQAAFLNNQRAFKELIPSPSLSPENMNGIEMVFVAVINKIHVELEQAFISVFSNKDFLELVKSSQEIHNELKKIFRLPSVLNLQDSSHYLKQLLDKIAIINPDNVRSYELVLRLFKNEGFIKNIKQLKFNRNNVSEMPMYDLLAALHTKARFYKRVKKEDCLFLFEQLWQKYKTEPLQLAELAKLMPSDKLHDWLHAHTDETRFVLDLMIKNTEFREDFLKCFLGIRNLQDHRIIELLVRKAKKGDIAALLIQSRQFAKAYFNNLNESAPDSEAVSRFIKIIDRSDTPQLGLLISKCPEILGSIEKFNLFGKFTDKIVEAITYANIIIPQDQMAELNHVDSNISKRMVEATRNRKDSSKPLKIQIKDLLASNDSKKAAKGIITAIHQAPTLESLIGLFEHKELINLLLRKASSHELTSIFKELERSVVDSSSTLMKIFSNSIVMKLIFDPNLRETLSLDVEDFSRFLGENTDLSLLIQLFKQESKNKPINLTYWYTGLDRILNNSVLFRENLTPLTTLNGFGHWVIRYLSKNSEPLLCLNDERGLLTEEALLTLLEASYPKVDHVYDHLLIVMQRQYRNASPRELLIRDVLLKSPQARTSFKIGCFTHADLTIELIAAEAERFGDTVLLQDWMQVPFIDYILTKADSSKIESLLETLERCGLSEKKNNIIDRYLNIVDRHSDIREKLFQSDLLLESCLTDGLLQNPVAARKLLTYAIAVPMKSKFISLLQRRGDHYVNSFINEIKLAREASVAMDKAPEERLSSLRQAQELGNALINIYCQLLAHINQSKHAPSEVTILLSLSEQLPLLLESDLDPSMQQQLFIALFSILGKGVFQYANWLADAGHQQASSLKLDTLRSKLFTNTSHEVAFANSCYTNLFRMDYTQEPRSLEKFMLSLTPAQTINLYQAAVAFGNDEKQQDLPPTLALTRREDNVIALRFIAQIESEEIAQRMFLHADQNKLAELFAVGPHLVMKFMRMAKIRPVQNRQPETKEVRLASELRERVLGFVEPTFNNLLTQLIRHTKPAMIDQQFQFLNSDRRLFDMYIKELQNISCISNSPEQLNANLSGIVVHGTSENIRSVILYGEAENGEKGVIQYFFNLLIGEDSPSKTKFLSGLSENENLRAAFFEAIKKNMTTKDIYQLLGNSAVEALFMDYFKQSPADLQVIFSADISRSVSLKDQDATNTNIKMFEKYFLDSPRNRQLYILLNQVNPGSILCQIIDNKLSDQALATLFLAKRRRRVDENTGVVRQEANANPRELAEFFNLELNAFKNNIKKDTPLVRMITMHDDIFRNMMIAFPLIDSDLLDADLLLDKLTFDESKSDETRANATALLNNFHITDNGLKLKAVPEHVLSQKQELIYFYAHNAEFSSKPTLRNQRAQLLIFDEYTNYINSVKQYIYQDKTGVLRFKGTDRPLPQDHSLIFYESLARFIYHPNRHNVRENIQKLPEFRKDLINSIKFDEQGKARLATENYSFEKMTPQRIKGVPQYYVDTVLYAIAHEDPAREITPNLANAFLRSVKYEFVRSEGRYYFSATKPRNNTLIKDTYLKKVKASVLLLLQSEPKLFSASHYAKLLVSMHQEFDLKQPEIREALLKSVYLDVDGKVRFKDSKEEAHSSYINAIIPLLPKSTETTDFSLFCLSHWATKRIDGNYIPIESKELLDLITLNGVDSAKFKNTTILMSSEWLQHALRHLNQLVIDGKIVENPKYFYLLPLLPNFEKLLKNNSLIINFLTEKLEKPNAESVQTDEFIKNMPRAFWDALIKVAMVPSNRGAYRLLDTINKNMRDHIYDDLITHLLQVRSTKIQLPIKETITPAEQIENWGVDGEYPRDNLGDLPLSQYGDNPFFSSSIPTSMRTGGRRRAANIHDDIDGDAKEVANSLVAASQQA